MWRPNASSYGDARAVRQKLMGVYGSTLKEPEGWRKHVTCVLGRGAAGVSDQKQHHTPHPHTTLPAMSEPALNIAALPVSTEQLLLPPLNLPLLLWRDVPGKKPQLILIPFRRWLTDSKFDDCGKFRRLQVQILITIYLGLSWATLIAIHYLLFCLTWHLWVFQVKILPGVY